MHLCAFSMYKTAGRVNRTTAGAHSGPLPYRTILGEPLGPENVGALGSIKEGHWVRKWRAIVSNCGLRFVEPLDSDFVEPLDCDLWSLWTAICGAFGL